MSRLAPWYFEAAITAVEAFGRRDFIGIGGVGVAVETDQHLVLVRERRQPLRHADLRRRRDRLDAEPFGHLERVLDLVVLRRADVHVVAEQAQVDAGVLDLLAHGRERRRRRGHRASRAAP